MKLIHNNFDGLEISFQCALPEHILRMMRKAKEEAQKGQREIFISVGEKAKPLAIAETGAKGGYTFRFDTGIDGETWLVSDNTKIDRWNVRVSVKSFTLALYGYSAVKEKILSFLVNDLEAYYAKEHDKQTGEILPHPKARISRFDYCFDFLSERFTLNPKHLITRANRMKKAYHFESAPPMKCFERFNAIESILLGKMPNRQLAIYNKTREITEKKKSYWWRIWNLEKELTRGTVWRIEVRAGKRELNQWNIRSFQDFEEKTGDAIIGILESIRYVKPNRKDSNRARWPMATFWEKCIKATKKDLESFISDSVRGEIIIEYENELRNRFEKHLNGTITSYAAILGCTLDELPGVLDRVSENALLALEERPEHYGKKHKDAQNRYQFTD